MKFLILGCNGMAGHMVSLYLKEQGHDVTGVARSTSSYVKTICLDVRDDITLKKVILNGGYDVVINCVGLLNQDAEQHKERAVYLNSYLPHHLAELTKDMDTRIFHISTDCVFSGKQGKYTEDSYRDGESFYARSKALGELDDDKNLTVRTSIVGPDIKPSGIGLINWFMQQSGSINGYTGAIWTGMTSLQLAKVLEAAAQSQTTGLYNLVPDNSICKCDLLKLFNHYFREDILDINPVEGINTDKSLLRTKFDFTYQVPDYNVMISELSDWMLNHKDMYPHYHL